MDEKIHATQYSARRRNRVLVCDTDRIPNQAYTQTTEIDPEVTCSRCLILLRDGTHRWDDAAGKWIAR